MFIIKRLIFFQEVNFCFMEIIEQKMLSSGVSILTVSAAVFHLIAKTEIGIGIGIFYLLSQAHTIML